MGTVVLVGTLDTKGVEYAFLHECLVEAGATVLLVDTGVLGSPALVPDISAAEVAQAEGFSLDSLRFAREGSDTRAVALAAMGRGAAAIVTRLISERRCDAILMAAGSGGGSIAAAVFAAAPLGLPKLLVTTMGQHLGSLPKTRDVTLMQSVTDIAGLNRVSRQILRNAAFAAAGMAAAGRPEPMGSARPLVGLTMFGITTPGVLRVERRLREAGFETITFHAVGTGGRAMEEMIEAGTIEGVIDYTVSELTDALLGGIFSAGPNRMEAAGRAGIPQVVVPGAIEVLNFGARSTVPPRFDSPERRLIVHNENVCAVCTTAEEAATLGRIFVEKLSHATGPTAVVLPLAGFDAYQRAPDGPWVDAGSSDAFLDVVRRDLRPDIPRIEIDRNANDLDFADEVFEQFRLLWARRRSASAKP